jgi:hypothetical protein
VHLARRAAPVDFGVCVLEDGRVKAGAVLRIAALARLDSFERVRKQSPDERRHQLDDRLR